MRVVWLLPLAMAGCQTAPTPSAPAATYAIEVNACVSRYDAQAMVDTCRAEAQVKLCASEPALCDGGATE